MKIKLPRLKKSAKGNARSTKRSAKALSGISGLLGNILNKNITNFTTAHSAKNDNTSSSGSANYKPLPALPTTRKNAKKYNNPTLVNVSEQLSNVLSKCMLIDKTLKAQLNFDKFEYKENARIQKEINTESKDTLLSQESNSLNFEALNAALSGFLNALALASTNLANDNGSILPDIPGFESAKKSEKGKGFARISKSKKFKQSQFVSKSEAFNKSGKLKSGYESVKDKSGRIVGYRKMASRSFFGEKMSGVSSWTKSAVGKIKSVIPLEFAGKLLTPAIIAYQSWEAWKEIKALPENMDPIERKNKVTKIVGKLVGSIGLMWAGAALGALAGSAVPGPGTLVGLIGGIAGGVAADYFFGDNVDSLVDMLVDKIYSTKPQKPTIIKSKSKVSKPLAVSSNTSVAPVAKPSVSTNKKTTINDLVSKVAAKIGIDPRLIYYISKLSNSAVNFNSDISSLKSAQLFGLTQDQWTQIVSKYSSAYPELNNGMHNPTAIITAASLLVKDAENFLNKNNLGIDVDKLYSAYLIGDRGLNTLFNSDKSIPIDQVVPQAVLKKPEYFSGADGKPVSVGDFLSKVFNIDNSITNNVNNSTSTPKVNTTSLPEQTQIQQNNPSIPKSDILSGGSDAKLDQSNPSAQIEQPAQNAPAPIASKPKLNSNQTSNPINNPSDNIQNITNTSQQNVTNASQLDNIQNITNTSYINNIADSTKITSSDSTGELINDRSMEVESLEESDFNITVVNKTNSSSNLSAPQSSDSIGTGNVPDPNFSLGAIAKQLFFETTPEGIWA